jgi:hypothetical protein
MLLHKAVLRAWKPGRIHNAAGSLVRHPLING